MKNQKLQATALTIFILSVLILALILAKNILVPLAISFLFTYLIYPITWRIERNGVPRVFSILLVIVVALVIMGLSVFYFSINLPTLSVDLNGIKQQILSESTSLKFMIEDQFGVDLNSMEYYSERAVDGIINAIQSSSGNIFEATATILFQVFILPVFTFFILFYRTKTAYFIFRLVGRKRRLKAIKILREVSAVTSKYLGGILLVVLILAFLNSLGLLIIGVPHAIVLGVGSALLNLIPYFGTLIGALIPIIYILISVPNPMDMAVQVVIMFIIVQFLENNIITPNVVGGNVKLNPLTIIIGLLVGNLIWGIPGMLIAIPYIAILKVVMRNIEI
ncbi:MAG TPA: AI-2E family transporter, partial [Prolixibacteraceae bacterium]|nr:AI-2E family transporter [Prolixibacteraceae bacterium]